MTSDFAKIGIKEKIGYGMGDAAFNFVWMTFIYFGTYFYTDVFGISAATVGLLFIVTRFWDVVNDPIMGIIADRTESKWGKFRPYLILGALPLGIAATLCFTTPDISDESKIIYAFVTYFIVGMVYTAVNIPYSSMLSVITSDRVERTGLSSARLVGAYSAGLIVLFFTNDLVKILGGGNEQQGYQYTMAIYSAILVLLLYFSFSWTKERLTPVRKESSSLGVSISIIIGLFALVFGPTIYLNLNHLDVSSLTPTMQNLLYTYYGIVAISLIVGIKLFKGKIPPDLRALLTNVPFMILFFVGIFTLSWVSIRGASIMYYFKYYLQDQDSAKYYMGFFTICNIAGAAGTQWLCKFWDKKNLYIALMLLNAVTIAAVFYVSPDNMGLFGTLHFANGLLAGPITVIVFSMYADIVDHTEDKTGQRIDGLIFSGASFSQKMGWAVGGSAAGFILHFYHYDANITPTAETIGGIKMMFTYIPAGLSVLAALAMAFYPLSDKALNEKKALS